MADKRTVLVIEDEEKYRRVIGLQLSSEGYGVKAVGTAEEGLNKLRTSTWCSPT